MKKIKEFGNINFHSVYLKDKQIRECKHDYHRDGFMELSNTLWICFKCSKCGVRKPTIEIKN